MRGILQCREDGERGRGSTCHTSYNIPHHPCLLCCACCTQCQTLPASSCASPPILMPCHAIRRTNPVLSWRRSSWQCCRCVSGAVVPAPACRVARVCGRVQSDEGRLTVLPCHAMSVVHMQRHLASINVSYQREIARLRTALAAVNPQALSGMPPLSPDT